MKGKVALVTGAGSGIGTATTLRLSSEGAHVYAVDIDQAALDALSGQAGGGAIIPVNADVASSGDWARLADAVILGHGRLDMLISNAFTEVKKPVHELSEPEWDRQIDVNLKAAYLGTRVFARHLEAAHGSIVLMSSVHTILPIHGRPAYAAAKGGLAAMGRQLAVEYGPSIRVNIIQPGPVPTPAWAPMTARDHQDRIAETALKRLGRTDEIAAVVAFLVSDEASYITGASIVVDGGWSIVKEPR